MDYYEKNFTNGSAEVKLIFTSKDITATPFSAEVRRVLIEAAKTDKVSTKLFALSRLAAAVEEKGELGEVHITKEFI